LARRGAEFGLHIPSVEVDFPAVLARAREIVLKSRHGLETWLSGNLYVVDGSFFPSSGAVNPALTIIANAMRVGDHLLERLG